MSYFPMFIELKNRHCLVVGGGQIALHKVKVLNDFGAHITVIAPQILKEIQEIKGVICCERNYKQNDIVEQELVVAATNHKELNHQISIACKKEKIPVNAVDQPEDCSFIFPAYLREGEVVAAFSSGGQSPVITQYLKAQMRPFITPRIGEIAACLGNLREMVKQCVKTEQARKEIYHNLLLAALENDAVSVEKELKNRIKPYIDESENIARIMKR